jgi:hypothetical protein
VDPDALEVVGGGLPVEEVVRVTPVHEEGSVALTAAHAELVVVADVPYLVGPVVEAVD